MIDFTVNEDVFQETGQKEKASDNGLSLDCHVCSDNLSIYYGDNRAVTEARFGMPRGQVTAIIGPSGCGKSTFLRAVNRMNDLIPCCRTEGRLLMDEPTSALDPKSTARIEDLIDELKGDLTIVIVTHNMQQAARVSDYTAFFYEGELVEFDVTRRIFTKPGEERTESYITGRFG